VKTAPEDCMARCHAEHQKPEVSKKKQQDAVFFGPPQQNLWVHSGSGRVPHHVKHREFDALRRSQAVRFSGGQFRLSVESLDDTR